MIEQKILWGSLITATLLFTGCSSDEAKSDAQVKVIAKSTYANATVCVDSNGDDLCQEDEVQTKSAENGAFELTYVPQDNQKEQLVAQGGFNLVTLIENSEEMVVVGSLDEKASHNINTLTTLIQEAVDGGLDYSAAKELVASRYNLEGVYLDADPLELLTKDDQKAYFLSIHAMETYSDVKDENRTLPVVTDLIVDGWNQEVASKRSASLQSAKRTSLEDADVALDNSDIFDFDFDAYFKRLGELISGFFDDLLAFFGFGDDSGDYEFNEANLENVPLRIYHNDFNKTSEAWSEEMWNYIHMMRTDDAQRIAKNYNDLDYILTTTQAKDSHGMVMWLYSLISEVPSTEALLEAIDRPYIISEFKSLDIAFLTLFATHHFNKDENDTMEDLNFDHAYLYEDYFQNSDNDKYRDIIGNAMVNLSEKEGLDLVINFIDRYYISSEIDYSYGQTPEDYTPKNITAEYLTKQFRYYKRDVASSALVRFYDFGNDRNINRKLRKAYASIANEITVEKLYAEASVIYPIMYILTATIMDPPVHEYVKLFTRVKYRNKNIGPFVTETLSPKYSFVDKGLKADIDTLFIDKP